MKPSHDSWNVLHDGAITQVSGVCPGTLSLKIEIPYLCDLLAKGSSFLWVHLDGCTLTRFLSFESSEPVDDLSTLTSMDLTVLSATETAQGVSVTCINGELRLAYSDARYVLEGDVPLEYALIMNACQKYWDDWERRYKGDA